MDIFSLFSKDSPRNARTIKDVKTYLSQRYDLLKLELLEKSSQLLSVILSMLIVVVCALAVLIYLSSALISWLTLALNAGWAYTIVCALFVVIILVVLHYKDMLFVKPLIRKFSRILYGRSEKGTSEPEEAQTPVEVIFDKEGDDHD
ncbi:MAG: phage holin family protein [Bacteroidales bacterium]|nr:phage holin family protein [Bacteroidales bacterium]MBR6161984.1 phage holin family protein [Bacteroidales bacterium]